MSYGDRLDAAMKAIDVDRKALASHLEISVQAVGQVLTGRTRALDAANHIRAALYLKCDPLWLATGEGSRTSRRAPHAWPFARLSPEQWATIEPSLKDKIETFAEGILTAVSQDDGSARRNTGTEG